MKGDNIFHPFNPCFHSTTVPDALADAMALVAVFKVEQELQRSWWEERERERQDCDCVPEQGSGKQVPFRGCFRRSE